MEERALLNKGPWNDIPEALLPSRVLNFCSTLILELSNEKNVQEISLLLWVTPYEVQVH